MIFASQNQLRKSFQTVFESLTCRKFNIRPRKVTDSQRESGVPTINFSGAMVKLRGWFPRKPPFLEAKAMLVFREGTRKTCCRAVTTMKMMSLRPIQLPVVFKLGGQAAGFCFLKKGENGETWMEI